jgi:glutaconate CoA-transferase subunit A
VGVQKEVVLASRTAIVTVEEVVDELRPPSLNSVVLPGWTVDAIAVVPRGARPSYAHGFYERDNGFYRTWDEIARDRNTFLDWVESHIMAATA